MVTAADVVAAECFRRPEQEDSKSNSSRVGPFAGPKPEPMTVPRGASRSNRRAHPSRLGWARGFLPSWPCEFDSRHPLHIKTPKNKGEILPSASSSPHPAHRVLSTCYLLPLIRTPLRVHEARISTRCRPPIAHIPGAQTPHRVPGRYRLQARQDLPPRPGNRPTGQRPVLRPEPVPAEDDRRQHPGEILKQLDETDEAERYLQSKERRPGKHLTGSTGACADERQPHPSRHRRWMGRATTPHQLPEADRACDVFPAASARSPVRTSAFQARTRRRHPLRGATPGAGPRRR